jgi:hypothetical protein
MKSINHKGHKGLHKEHKGKHDVLSFVYFEPYLRALWL